jgi:cytochrome c oxidase accessory protein FixG
MLSARPVQGRFRNLRWGADAILVVILLVIPWIRIDGQPLVLLDVPARQFHVFGLTIFPQELYFLWLIVVGLALCLFFFTTLAGRLWCGWACPQTVFTDLYAAVARRIQGWSAGGPPRRLAAWRKLLTHTVWLLLSVFVGLHVVGYFRSPYDILSALRAGEFSGASMGFWAVGTALAYFDFGLLRQTFCKYLCPYARFQGVLFDRETLVVAYDAGRGEPRGKRGRVAGDCIDCGLCVEVCPTGIDIRHGLQMECIACTQCIDACDQVMTQIDRRPNLIRYASLDALEGGRGARWWRPRVLVYGGLLAATTVAFAAALATRLPLDLQVEHNRSPLFHRTADGRIGNAFTLHLQNRDRADRQFRLQLEPGTQYDLVAGLNPVQVPAVSTVEARVFVIENAGNGSAASRTVRFVLEDVEDPGRRVERISRFVLPATGGG